MKRLFLLLLIPTILISMYKPLPGPVIPFGSFRKLISFADSIRCGTFKAALQEDKSAHLEFSDYKDHTISYQTPLDTAYYAIEYMAALGLMDTIETEKKTLQDIEKSKNGRDEIEVHLPAERRESLYKLRLECTQQRLKEAEEKLKTLSAQPNPPTYNISHLHQAPPDLSSKASAQEKEKYKSELLCLFYQWGSDERTIFSFACTRFFCFWSNEDLGQVTNKDSSRDITPIKENRAALFTALKNNDAALFATTASKPIIKKTTLTTLGYMHKAIQTIKNDKHLDPSSPQNSDDELF